MNYQLLVRVMFVLSECLGGQANLEPDQRLNLEGLAVCIAPSVFTDATQEMLHPKQTVIFLIKNLERSYLLVRKMA